jgi:hypothetical protein
MEAVARRVAQIAGERGRRLTERTAELLREPGQHDRVIPGRDAAHEVAALQLRERVTQHLTSHRVGINETAPGIDDGDPLLGTGHHTGQRQQTSAATSASAAGPVRSEGTRPGLSAAPPSPDSPPPPNTVDPSAPLDGRSRPRPFAACARSLLASLTTPSMAPPQIGLHKDVGST